MIALLLACTSAPTPTWTGTEATLEVALANGPLSPSEGRELLELRRTGASRPVAGRYHVDDGVLTFTPASAVQGDLELVASDRTWPVSVPSPTAPEVVAVWPSADVLPANHLKLTVALDVPSSPRGLHERARLIGPDGPVDRPWREQPLWNADRTEATLLIHPGRVKQDIGYAAGMGPVLVEGVTYTVEVGGQPIKTFTVGPPDHQRPEPDAWTVTFGATVELRFDEPVDRPTALHAFEVRVSGQPIAGDFSLHDGESVLRFTPVESPTGTMELVRVGRVEDQAGNTPERAFDGPADNVRRTRQLDRWSAQRS